MHQAKDANEIIRKLEPVLNELTYDELVILNRMSADRLRFMHRADDLMQMAKFNVGDTVYWTKEGRTYSGVITRLNQKTVSVRTSENGQWTVPPSYLRRQR